MIGTAPPATKVDRGAAEMERTYAVVFKKVESEYVEDPPERKIYFIAWEIPKEQV